MPLRLILAGLLLLTALGLGLVGYQATRPPVTVRVASEAAAPPLTVGILVAARSLPAGTLMKEEDFSQRAVPAADVPPGVLTNSPEVRAGLHGALLRRYLDSGSSLMADDILHPRDRGFLAAVLAPDARAVSVAVDPVTGDGGLIWPGDRVDLILAQELGEKNAPPSRHFVGETVLSDVRVVAVDQSIIQGAVATGDNATGRLARTVTLEVTPEQAERAVVAERLGKITLAIRALNGIAGARGHRPAVYGGDVSAALGDSPPHMRVVEGKDDREVTFQRQPASPLITPSQGPANARP
jgi:pilus assembly protein CpaB